MGRTDEQLPERCGGDHIQGADICMSEGKTVYHIETDRDNASRLWSLLSDSFSFTVTKKQHSLDGNDLNISIRIVDEKQ